jgi:predicted DNA-binding protein (MmcQ/YjbR family)
MQWGDEALTVDALRTYCLGKSKDVTEGFPFGEDTLVFKVRGKIFLLFPLDVRPQTVNLKCDPERAVELRELYEAVRPGYHMNKKHWNTIVFDGTIPPTIIREMIDHSYDLVSRGAKGTPKKPAEKRKRRKE